MLHWHALLPPQYSTFDVLEFLFELGELRVVVARLEDEGGGRAPEDPVALGLEPRIAPVESPETLD